MWDTESRECLEVIGGGREIEGIAGGAQAYPWWALRRSLETVVESAGTREAVAWLQLGLRETAAHPQGRTWASAAGDYLSVFILKGEPEAVRSIAHRVDP